LADPKNTRHREEARQLRTQLCAEALQKFEHRPAGDADPELRKALAAALKAVLAQETPTVKIVMKGREIPMPIEGVEAEKEFIAKKAKESGMAGMQLHTPPELYSSQELKNLGISCGSAFGRAVDAAIGAGVVYWRVCENESEAKAGEPRLEVEFVIAPAGQLQEISSGAQDKRLARYSPTQSLGWVRIHKVGCQITINPGGETGSASCQVVEMADNFEAQVGHQLDTHVQKAAAAWQSYKGALKRALCKCAEQFEKKLR
jgi:hypothetical protein